MTSIFSTVYNIKNSTSNLNSNLQHVCKWAFKWKMSFNPDPTEQAQEVIFSRKLIKPIHPLSTQPYLFKMVHHRRTLV